MNVIVLLLDKIRHHIDCSSQSSIFQRPRTSMYMKTSKRKYFSFFKTKRYNKFPGNLEQMKTTAGDYEFEQNEIESKLKDFRV